MSTSPTGNRLVFARTFEVLKAAARPLSPALASKLKAVGVDFGRPLEASYPLPVWGQAMSLIAEELFQGGTVSTRQRQLGRKVLEAYAEGVVGRMVMGLARVLGPRRMLERSARDLRSANNYLQLEVHTDAPNRHRLIFEHIGFPDFCAGLLERAAELAGASQVQVTIHRTEGEHGEFQVTWS
jgi:uncharacterized protein (TIGR02265 family)